MKFIRTYNGIIILTSILFMSLITGCTTYKKYESDNKIVIKKFDSIKAHIKNVGLFITEEHIVKLRGELVRRTYLLAPIPGHLDIQLVNLKGAIIKTIQLNYRHIITKSRLSVFSIDLPVDPTRLSVIRIKHHDAGPHQSGVISSPWQDVNPNN